MGFGCSGECRSTTGRHIRTLDRCARTVCMWPCGLVVLDSPGPLVYVDMADSCPRARKPEKVPVPITAVRYLARIVYDICIWLRPSVKSA